MDPSAPWVLLPLVGFGLLVIFLSSFVPRGLPLPPGPTTSWFGKVKLPKSHPWRTYTQWKDTYGDLAYIYIFGNPILVLNSAQAVSDLLEKRSANYSSRPVRTMVVELIGWDWLFSSMTYGTKWKRHRNLFLKHFPLNGTSEYHALQTQETHTLLRNLLQNPDKFPHHIRRCAAAIILKITYGIKIDEHVDEDGDNYVSLADRAMKGLAQAGIFGTYLVDYLPILKHIPPWFPGASFRRQAAKWRKPALEMVNRPFDIVKRKMTDGNVSPCVVANELEDLAGSGKAAEDELTIRNVAATTYAAGADTVVSVIHSLFLAMTVHPEVQEKAQFELDQVVGGRLPTFADRSQLPYIDYICYELLRWNPVTPLGLAHYVSADDEYNGYRIPKGTTVLPNVWALLHDPAVYPDPLSFNPDRFRDHQKNITRGINEIPDAAFGFGRRMCPGRSFAFDSLWIAVASILTVYTISHALDENGQTIEPNIEYTSHLLSHPKPFQCCIVPRSLATASLISQTVDDSL